MATTTTTTTPKVPPAGIWAPAVTFFDPETDEIDLEAQKKYYTYLSQHLTGTYNTPSIQTKTCPYKLMMVKQIRPRHPRHQRRNIPPHTLRTRLPPPDSPLGRRTQLSAHGGRLRPQYEASPRIHLGRGGCASGLCVGVALCVFWETDDGGRGEEVLSGGCGEECVAGCDL